jgi:transposase
VTALRIDDFSFKRGRTCGTILVDLSAQQVIDLLPERTTASAAAWMREHPEVRSVSRDRGQDYATACREGAPQATAVADRFHVMKNFVEALEPEVSRCYRHLRQTHLPLPAPALPTPDEWRQAPDADVVRKRRARQPSKQERFEQAKDLFSQGVSLKEIASQLIALLSKKPSGSSLVPRSASKRRSGQTSKHYARQVRSW